MTLTDAGPLIAIINRNDPNHGSCRDALHRLRSGPLITTWPCYTEAMHLLFRAGGHAAQLQLWRLVFDGKLLLHDLPTTAVSRSADLMAKYSDHPMDLADATLVATAELLGVDTIFTLDSDFYAYRLADGATLAMIP